MGGGSRGGTQWKDDAGKDSDHQACGQFREQLALLLHLGACSSDACRLHSVRSSRFRPEPTGAAASSSRSVPGARLVTPRVHTSSPSPRSTNAPRIATGPRHSQTRGSPRRASNPRAAKRPTPCTAVPSFTAAAWAHCSFGQAHGSPATDGPRWSWLTNRLDSGPGSESTGRQVELRRQSRCRPRRPTVNLESYRISTSSRYSSRQCV